jgi:hypothetical protein
MFNRSLDCTIAKADLKKKKHTEESVEGWVECEGQGLAVTWHAI